MPIKSPSSPIGPSLVQRTEDHHLVRKLLRRGSIQAGTDVPELCLARAGNFVRRLQTGSPDEIAYNLGWMDREGLAARMRLFGKSSYGRFLDGLLHRLGE